MFWGGEGAFNEKGLKIAREVRGEEDIQRGFVQCDTASEVASTSPSEISSNMSTSMPNRMKAFIMHCHVEGWSGISFVSDVFILISGVAANAALVWLFLRERKSLSASQVLGLNLVVMNLIYLSIMPVFLIEDIDEQDQQVNPATDWRGSNTTHPVEKAETIFSMLNLIGCPLLLTCMCIERYLAVIRPVLYLRVRKWEYRMAVSAVVWLVTLSFCLATGLMKDPLIIMLLVTIIISCLFLIMIACLGGMVWSLQQQSPAHTTYGNQARSESPLKRRAVGNVLVVVVPAVVSYLPVLMIVPLFLLVYYRKGSLDKVMCYVFQLSITFPRFGVLIGPLFYLSKARQMCCLS